MFRDLRDGLISYIDALAMIRKYRLWKYSLWAGFVCLLVGLLAVLGAYSFAGNLASLLTGWMSFLPDSGIFVTIAEWLSGIFIFLVFLIVYKYVILIVMAPFMSPLSEELEKRLNENYETVQFSFSSVLKDLWRGLRINIRNLVKELLYTILLFVASFIPGVAIVTTPLLLLVQAYYAGFGNMDYYLERHYDVGGSSRFVKIYKGLAIGNGAIFLFILMIPVIGLFLAPTLATVAATLECEKRNHS